MIDELYNQKKMKSFICLILFLNLFPHFLTIIPNWDITKIGEDLMTRNTITYTVCTKDFYGHSLVMTRNLTKGDQTITKTNIVKIGSLEREVNFDNIGSFYHFNGNYYICPKGYHHIYDFTNNEIIIPSEFEDKGRFDLKCFYHSTTTFIVSYLMNGEYYLYGIYITSGKSIKTINRITHRYSELYDFKIDSTLLSNAEYYMLALTKEDSYIRLSNTKAIFRENKYAPYDQNLNQINTEPLNESRTYMQGYFKVSDTDTYNDFFYIAYDDLDNFYSGYSTYAPNFGNLNPAKWEKNKASFEFYEDVEIEEMNFMMYNRYVYYKMKLKSTGETKYYGIYDTKLNNVIFNTEEYIKYFIPYSDREMLAITNTAAYKICAMKGTDGTCTDYCDKYYLLDTQGNKCSTTNSCPAGKIKLMPSGVCNETCDEDIYYLNKTNNYCGLCQYFNPTGNKFKLVGNKECRGSKDDNTMDYYKEKFNLLKCKNGYIMKNNDCVKDMVCYETCQTCSASSSNPYEQNCLTCKSGYFLENSNCVKTCSKGYGKKGQNCESCNDNICDSFVTDSCDCTNCQTHYFINQNKRCSECNINCSECSQTATTCTSCWPNNFLYNSQCYKCATNCAQFENDGENCKCLKCDEGFYNSNYQCKNCLSNCLTCTNSTKCIACKSGYFVDSKGQCSVCPIEKCATLKSDVCQCETCADNYFMNSNQECEQCSTQCKTCINKDNCTSCTNNNYFVNENNLCEKCDETCATCSINKTYCTSCPEGKYVTEENKCDECDDICQTCFSGPSDGDSNCLSCKDDFYLIYDYKNKTCVNDCTLYEREKGDEPFKCKPLINGTTEPENNEDNEVDYLLWIFIIVAGVLLIIVTICICIKCCHNKSDDIMEEINTELVDKEEKEEMVIN